jgi:transcriptional regulator with XRE-family HTH domain
MNQYITGAIIRELRERNNLTQAELAEKLNVSDKTVSKWETGKGYPDIALLEPIAEVFNVSVTEILSGVPISNMNVSANMIEVEILCLPCLR